MIHKMRRTAEKISQRIDLIESLVYRRHHPLSPFRHSRLADPSDEPPVGPDVDDSGWPVIEPYTYWGRWVTDYILRTEFPGTSRTGI